MHNFLATLEFLYLLPVKHPMQVIVMIVLLLLSASFSGSETALFSLTNSELNKIRSDTGSVSKAIIFLQQDLSRLLLTILFGNMAVNILFFSLTTAVTVVAAKEYNNTVAFYYGLLGLVLVIFFGEVMPKQIAFIARISVVKITAIPLMILHKILRKPLEVINKMVIVSERILNIKVVDQELKDEELFMLIEYSKDDGVISEDEYELIDSIVDLPLVKVREIMIPRIDVKYVSKNITAQEIVKLAKKTGAMKLPVFDNEKDDYIGWIDSRDIFINEIEENWLKYLQSLAFVSELDNTDQVLIKFRDENKKLAMVVDERGIIVGMITQQDIVDEIFGHIGEYGNAPPEQITKYADSYVVTGALSTRKWQDIFKVSSQLPKSVTVGGLITSLLDRTARVGDKVYLGNMEMTVLSVKKNRINEVKISLVNNDNIDSDKK